jgi:hypothetical protein
LAVFAVFSRRQLLKGKHSMAQTVKAAVVVFIGMVSAFALDISLSGTVRDDDGAPVPNAHVTTTTYRYSEYADEVSAESDSAGNFSLTARNLATGYADSRHPESIQFSIQKNMLAFTSLPGSISGRLDIMTIDGRRVLSLPFDLSAGGKREINIPGRSALGLYFIRLQMDGRVYTGRLLRLGGWMFTSGNMKYDRGGNPTLAEAGGVTDTLVATKSGYVVSRMPIESYEQTDMSITLSTGVLRRLFLVSDTMLPGWKTGYSTADSSFTLWNGSDIYNNINGGGEKYVVNGMLQAADLNMTGPESTDGTPRKLSSQSSFIIDFGTEPSAKKMFLIQKEQYFDDDAQLVEGFGDSVAFATTHLTGATVYSYKKQFYFELSLTGFEDISEAVLTGKAFLEYFTAKVR